ncbi:SulP family inorganic anion transporter [bacterium]|nr:SulP family inorganic anion transporter [bacterium]
MNQLQKYLPFLNWLSGYGKPQLGGDIVAGLTGAVIALPQGVAFAMIAGLPPEYGLYTAIITPIVAALFGSSWHMVTGPTTAISIVVFATLSDVAEPGSAEFVQLAFTMAFWAGMFQFILGVSRMGTLVNFVSYTVIIGFTAGAAILIVTSQVKHVIGVDIPRGGSFLDTWINLFKQGGGTNLYTLTVALGTLASALLVKYFLPKWPYMLIAMFLGSLLAFLMDAASHGVVFIGEMPANLPPLSAPDLSLSSLKKMAPDALAVALLGLIGAVSIAKSIASQTHQRIEGNQEFIGQGLSNIVGSFFSCYPVSGSFTRSGINHQAGARTPMSSIFAAVFLALILLFIAQWTAYIPIPAMGGIILLVGYNLIEFDQIRKILKTSKSETATLVVTFLATLFLDLEFAIYVGVLLSLVFYLQKASHPKVVSVVPNPDSPNRTYTSEEHIDVSECPQLRVIRIDGSLFFGAVDHVSNKFQQLEEAGHTHLLILGKSINFIDIAGAEWLVQESEKWTARGGGLYFQGLKKDALKVLQKGEYMEKIGKDHFFVSKEKAISHIFDLLDKGVCQDCSIRIFTECKAIEPTKIPT